ncbi:hypothetical protein BGZ65_007761 [Modicella reniformis]|uniref:Single-stranded DNA binding protein Ssb-like OB fold domain-containing protein n=1 Tax=Modicella reniformis TaxID=1440133 RepID=A0A9P6JGU7_9FUNG|nr:hypothetical protein BGZ65_007761 [Modicella reniformis]
MTTQSGKIIQSAEAIVGDDTACILLNLKNDQIHLLAKLKVVNGHVNMYRGFMRLEVNEEDDGDGSESCDKPSITAILDNDEDGLMQGLNQDDDERAATSAAGNHPSGYTQTQRGSLSSSSSSSLPSGATSEPFGSNEASAHLSTANVVSGTGGSVSLMEYYRTIVPFTYFSTVETVKR